MHPRPLASISFAFSYLNRPCSHCLHQSARRNRNPDWRALSTSRPLVSSGRVHLSNRRLLIVSGADATKFLQGLTTNNVDPSRTKGWYTAFLHAQGRVLYEGFIFPVTLVNHSADQSRAHISDIISPKNGSGDYLSYVIDIHATEVESLSKHLKRHRLRSKVDFRVINEGELDVWMFLGQSGVVNEKYVSLKDQRAPCLGSRVLIPGEISRTFKESQDGVGTLEDYDSYRYLLGVPEGPHEIVPGQALPMESNIDLMGGIDFTKGCYVGQELTIRTAHTGVVRKRILPVHLYLSGSRPPSIMNTVNNHFSLVPPPGIGITTVQGNDIGLNLDASTIRRGGRARAAGNYLKGIGNVGLALCRLETMTDIRLTAEGGGWHPEREFEMRWGTSDDTQCEVRAKAFVPEWYKDRQRIKPQQKSDAATT